MSIEILVFMAETKMPSRDVWQSAIDSLGYPATLFNDFALQDQDGFLPVVYQGADSGFEFFIDDAFDVSESYPLVQPLLDGRDKCATFAFGGDYKEASSAMLCAAALAQVSDGILYDPQSDKSCTGIEAPAWATTEVGSLA